MAHTVSDRRLRARLQEFQGDQLAAAKRLGIRELRHARRLVALWNKRAERGVRPSFYPTIRTAIAAGAPIVEALCPGCQTIGSVDLRKLDHHPAAAISSLIPRLSCQRCCPNPPFAKLVGLKPSPPLYPWECGRAAR